MEAGVLTAGFVLTWALLMLVKQVFPKLGIMDSPEKFGLARSPVPYSAGVVLFVVTAILSLAILGFEAKLLGLLAAAGVIVATGFADDMRNLSPGLRLALQAVAACIILLSGVSIPAITNPLGGTIELHNILGSMLLILWIVGMTNTMNLLDGIPGLVSGVTTIASFVLFLLAARPEFHVIDQASLMVLVAIMASSTLAFWLFDAHPPRLLMGDSGSTFLGFMLAVLAIFAGAKIATAFIVMGFPIFDAILTIFRRMAQKKSPFRGDRQHLHHDLLRAGLSERQTMAVIYGFCVLFGLTALYLDSFQKLVAIIVIFIIMTALKIFLVRRYSSTDSLE